MDGCVQKAHDARVLAQGERAHFERSTPPQFTQNRALCEQMLCTVGTTLVECNEKDRRWGIGLALNDARRLHR
jgi:predicted NAD-dependent protein-ADP-ribosyltransferase YbiA (DUF1768 family)